MYLYLKPDFYNLYLCTELPMGLYIVYFYSRLKCGLCLTLKEKIRPLFKTYCASLEVSVNNLVYIILAFV